LLKNVIKKRLEIESNQEEYEYESTTLVYCKEVNMMVPLVRVSVGILLKMQGFWNNDNDKTLEIVVESCKGMDDEPILRVKGSP